MAAASMLGQVAAPLGSVVTPGALEARCLAAFVAHVIDQRVLATVATAAFLTHVRLGGRCHGGDSDGFVREREMDARTRLMVGVGAGGCRMERPKPVGIRRQCAAEGENETEKERQTKWMRLRV